MACPARVKKQPTIDGCCARSRNGYSVREARGSCARQGQESAYGEKLDCSVVGKVR